MALIAAISAAFVAGLLIGDRRGVKEANRVLEYNWRELLRIMNDLPKGDESTPDEREPEKAHTTLH